MKVLLTGGTGFIGRNLKENCWGNKEVFAPSRKELNLLDSEMTEEYLKKNLFDVIIHTANTNDFRDSLSPYDILNQNLKMFFNLEKNHQYYGKMIYLGSGAEYASDFYEPRMTESYFGKHIPKDAYGFAKYVMSKITEKSENIYDLRLFAVYGKYEQWQRRFISNALCRSLSGLPITIQQNVFFDYMYVSDLSIIMEWFVTHTPKYRHYNVCSGKSYDLFSIANIINKVTGLNAPIIVGKPGFKREYSGDNGRLLEEIKEYSFEPLEKGIEKLYAYYKEHLSEIDTQQLI